jgi:hypothetical protein
LYETPSDIVNAVPEGYVTQTISAYRAGGAEEVMRRLRTELANCKTHTEGNTKYTVTIDRKPRYGDDAIHIVETPPTPTAPDNNNPSNRRILVIRVGDVVTVLSLDPWEQWTINRDHAELFGQLSVEAIEDWR